MIMAVVMLVPLLLSCSKSKSGNKVKDSDPWYESVRFDIESEGMPTEMYDGSAIGYSNGKIFHLYNLTNLADYEDYRRAFLDIFDEQGNMLSRVKITDPSGYAIDMVIGIKPDGEGKTAEVLARLFAPGTFETGLITLDLESGVASDPRLFKGKDGGALNVQNGFMEWSGVADIYSAGDYYIPLIYSEGSGNTLKANAFAFRGSEYCSELDLTGIQEFYALDAFSYNSNTKTVLTVGYSRDGMMVLEFDPESGKRISCKDYSLS